MRWGRPAAGTGGVPFQQEERMREERLQKSWVFGGIAELEIERSLEEQNRGGGRFFFPGRDLRSRRGRLWTWRGGDYSEQRKKKGNSGGRRLQTE